MKWDLGLNPAVHFAYMAAFMAAMFTPIADILTAGLAAPHSVMASAVYVLAKVAAAIAGTFTAWSMGKLRANPSNQT